MPTCAAHRATHKRLTRTLGRASSHACANGCGRQAMDWAFDLPTGFSDDLTRYRPLCRSCHVRADITPERRARTAESTRRRAEQGLKRGSGRMALSCGAAS